MTEVIRNTARNTCDQYSFDLLIRVMSAVPEATSGRRQATKYCAKQGLSPCFQHDSISILRLVAQLHIRIECYNSLPDQIYFSA